MCYLRFFSAHLQKRVSQLSDDAAPIIGPYIAIEVQPLLQACSRRHVHRQQLEPVLPLWYDPSISARCNLAMSKLGCCTCVGCFSMIRWSALAAA